MVECKASVTAAIELPKSLQVAGDLALAYPDGITLRRHEPEHPAPGRFKKKHPPRVMLEAEKVVRGFNVRAFRREQPSDPALMQHIVADAIVAEAPIPFIMYWGKGPRSAIAEPDLQCLDFLTAFVARVRDVFHHGATVRLIFTDTHAEHNGHSAWSIRGYFDDIAAVAARRGFDSCWLGQVLQSNNVAADDRDAEMPAEMGARLIASAQKWYRGGESVEQGALKYYRLNMRERRALERAFPGTIFITYNSSDYLGLCPERLPVFYMYTLRRGFRIKPWFLPANANTEAADPVSIHGLDENT